MTLCGRRPEGFGPKSILASPIPTSCFVDTILIPLPIWIALFLLPIFFFVSFYHRKNNYDPSTAHIRTRPQRTCGYKTVAVLYYALILANMLMQVLEIVRLEMIKYGIGLLPFTFVGLLLGGILHWTEGFKGWVQYWQSINAVLWTGGMAVVVVKVVGLCNEGIDTRKGSKYPMEDQVTDTAVIAGVYAIMLVLEVVLGAWKRRSTKGSDELSLGSGTSPVMEERGFGLN